MSTKANTRILNLFCILPIAIITVAFYWDGMRTYFCTAILYDLVPETVPGTGWTPGPSTRMTTYGLFISLYHLFGLNPLPYHVAALSIHLANSILVFFVARKLADSRLVGFITALLFSTFWAHPEPIVTVELVHEAFLACFVLSTLVSFYTYRQNPTKLNYFLALFFALLAIASKETAPFILIPLIYLTDKYIELEFPGLSRTKLSKTPYIPFLLLSIGLMVYVRFSLVYDSKVREVAHYDIAFAFHNFVRWISYTFSFPFLSEAPRWGNVNLILLALFYLFSPMQIRSRISLLMAAAALLAIPTAPTGSPALRYLYLSSFFSMTMFALMLFHGTTRLLGTIRVKEDFSRILVLVLCTMLVYYNYFYVNKLIKYYTGVRSISEKVITVVSSSFPSGTLNTHLFFINFPSGLKDEHSKYPDHGIDLGYAFLRAYYGQDKVGQVSQVYIPEVRDDDRYRLPDTRSISPLEFESIAKEKGNRLYFFNSKDGSIHDVTGKDYAFLKELVGGS